MVAGKHLLHCIRGQGLDADLLYGACFVKAAWTSGTG